MREKEFPPHRFLSDQRPDLQIILAILIFFVLIAVASLALKIKNNHPVQPKIRAIISFHYLSKAVKTVPYCFHIII